LRASTPSLGSFTLHAALAAGALAAACGAGHDAAGPSCKPGAAGVDTGADFAPSLDAYCMVSVADGAVVPNGAATPYDVNTPLFSDYAVKYRTVWLPPSTSVSYTAEGRFEFPVGTVITKSFGFPADFRVAGAPVKWIETRVLIRAASGWTGSSYIWDDAQKEALASPGGDILSFSFIDSQGNTQSPSYLVPSEAECKKCHANDGSMITLGPGAAQLNRDFAYPGGVENELVHWSRVGLLSGAPSPAEAPKLAVWDDPTTGDTPTRARAYLQANCYYCHNGTGEARTTGLVLSDDPAADAYALGLCKPPVAAGKAAENEHYDIVPGHPEQSILLYRMQSTAPSIMMPELGRSLEHVEAAQLVSDWIAGLSGSCDATP
jgi:uncharacterized repeat protein (TIGR03806 family)